MPKFYEGLKLLNNKFDKLEADVAIPRNANSLLLTQKGSAGPMPSTQEGKPLKS